MGRHKRRGGGGRVSGIRQDITGRKFNFLTATKYIGNCFKTRHSVWEFYCHCGRIVNRRACMVKSGKTKSCGCMNWKKEKDGYIFRSNHPLYETWVGMMRRCYVKTRRNYMFYGGRGITVCDRWKKFDEFVSDMGERPNGMTLDRIDNNGNYEIGNVQWTTNSKSNLNKRIPKNNSSGIKGVSKRKNGDWSAQAWKDGKQIHLYQGKSFLEACNARQLWEVKQNNIDTLK